MLTHTHETERLSAALEMRRLRWAAPGVTVALDVPRWTCGPGRLVWSVSTGRCGIGATDERAARAAAAAECRRQAAALLEAATALEDGGEG